MIVYFSGSYRYRQTTTIPAVTIVMHVLFLLNYMMEVMSH